jgi:hypothetical protein
MDEGSHSIYLWLRDEAGNVDHTRHNVKNSAFRLDLTPPATSYEVLGTPHSGGWYTTTVNVQLRMEDPLSGPNSMHYRVNGGDWVTGTLVTLDTDGEHEITYYARDLAGNRSPEQEAEVPVDMSAPAAPLMVEPYPLSWTDVNDFSVSWSNPQELSGIVAACYKLNGPPAGPEDGACSSDAKRITGIRVPNVGKHDLYLWLVDGAGNSDYLNYTLRSDAFWYDSIPPTTTLELDGTPGAGDWYVGPVEVRLNATDEGSGVERTQYRLNRGPWQTDTQFTITQEGSALLEYRSVDFLGHWESPHQIWVRIDTIAPQSAIISPISYVGEPAFNLIWGGTDPEPGSGISTYDVEYRDGVTGSWTPLRTGTSDTSWTFAGQRGHIYYFRVRSRDQAGNQESFPISGAETSVFVDPLANGGFSTGDLSFWDPSGVLSVTVESQAAPGGGRSLVTCLGSPDYGPANITPTAELPDISPNGSVPIGSARITQAIEVPSLEVIGAPALAVWYRVRTYDIVWTERFQRYNDDFEIRLADLDGGTLDLALRDGNWESVTWDNDLIDLGWRRAVIDLRAYAGQTIQVELSNWNRHDHFFNTWTCVDDVRVVNGSAVKVFIPLGGRGYTGSQPLVTSAALTLRSDRPFIP